METGEQRSSKRHKSGKKGAAGPKRAPETVILVLDDTVKLTDEKSIK